jgi:hypothetical protein
MSIDRAGTREPRRLRADAGPLEETPASGGGAHELQDLAVGHAAQTGIIAGVVVCYPLMVAICLLAGTGLGVALLLALWPALFAGPFFGGVVSVGRLVSRVERPPTRSLQPERPAGDQAPERRAA